MSRQNRLVPPPPPPPSLPLLPPPPQAPLPPGPPSRAYTAGGADEKGKPALPSPPRNETKLPSADDASSRPKSAYGKKEKPLHLLTVAEVGALLVAHNMDHFRASFQAGSVDGARLARVQSTDELKVLGVTLTTKATLLLRKIEEYKEHGVPLSILSSGDRGLVEAEEAAAALSLHQANMAMKSKGKEEAIAAEKLSTATRAMKTKVREEVGAGRVLQKANSAMKAMVREDEAAAGLLLKKSNENMKAMVREEEEAGKAMLRARQEMRLRLKEQEEEQQAAAAMEAARLAMRERMKGHNIHHNHNP